MSIPSAGAPSRISMLPARYMRNSSSSPSRSLLSCAGAGEEGRGRRRRSTRTSSILENMAMLRRLVAVRWRIMDSILSRSSGTTSRNFLNRSWVSDSSTQGSSVSAVAVRSVRCSSAGGRGRLWVRGEATPCSGGGGARPQLPPPPRTYFPKVGISLEHVQDHGPAGVAPRRKLDGTGRDDVEFLGLVALREHDGLRGPLLQLEEGAEEVEGA